MFILPLRCARVQAFIPRVYEKLCDTTRPNHCYNAGNEQATRARAYKCNNLDNKVMSV